jgi:hypothetical protein
MNVEHHQYPRLEGDLRRLAVGFSAGNLGLAMLACRLDELAAQARASLAKRCGAVGRCAISRSNLVCCLAPGHDGEHNTAADGTGDAWRSHEGAMNLAQLADHLERLADALSAGPSGWLTWTLVEQAWPRAVTDLDLDQQLHLHGATAKKADVEQEIRRIVAAMRATMDAAKAEP